MESKSRLLKILRAAEDVLLFFNDYFQSTSWVYYGTDLTRAQLRKSKSYLKKKKLISSDFQTNETEKSVLSLIRKPWDKKWRLVTFDIPEKMREDRDQLNYQLEKLGFKHFQRSVWISPLPVNDYLKAIAEQIGNRNYLSIFIGGLLEQNPKKLVEDLWEIDWWQEKAEDLLVEIERGSMSMENKKQFWDLVLAHPKIPLDLLPSNWPLEKMAKAFGEKVKHKPSR
jgi:CRISPR-associated endonuclease Cas2